MRNSATSRDASAGLVHIIDDDDAVRDSLSSLIRSAGNEALVYASIDSFLAASRPNVPSCLLLDIRLPGANGLDFQSSLQRQGIRIPVILMTGFGDIQMSVRGMKAGAIDFLTKPLRHQDLLDAIATAVGRDVERRREETQVAAIRERYETLTPRELEVALLVTSGKMNKQVAGDLRISEITVKQHRGSVMRKMGVRSLADLVKTFEFLKSAETRAASQRGAP
jgi:FixJ family two-component response regulator